MYNGGAPPSGYGHGGQGGYGGAPPSGYGGAPPSGYGGAPPSGYAQPHGTPPPGTYVHGGGSAPPSGYGGAPPSGASHGVGSTLGSMMAATASLLGAAPQVHVVHHGHHGHPSPYQQQQVSAPPPVVHVNVGHHHQPSHNGAMDHHCFKGVLGSVQRATFSSDKHNALRGGISGARISCAQASDLVRCFTHDSDQIEACVTVYPHVVDQQRWADVLNVLKFSSSREEVQKRLGCGSHPGHAQPTYSAAPPSGYSSAPPSGYGHSAPPSGYGHSAPECSQHEFSRYVSSVKQATFSSDKLSAIKLGLQPVSCTQASVLVKMINGDSDQQAAAIALYPYVIDKHHFSEVLNSLTFSSSRKSVMRKLGL
eukprot:TRINITY_DN383_c0_g1_i1.p1 TRINITY_DN383_c0_g1~~TRINITY_DN383_c0_g1_i1.p1  ORF type:complete len:366 (+),score=-66.89 TRINITY_DN383_c0_g1_i1:757-1854(+)